MNFTEKKNYFSLVKELKTKTIKNNYLLVGEEEFSKWDIINKIKKLILPEKDDLINYYKFIASETRADDLFNVINQSTLISKNFLVLIEDIDNLNPKSFKVLTDALNFDYRERFIIMTINQLDSLKKKQKEIPFNKIETIYFWKFRESEQYNFIKQKLEKHKIKIDKKALPFLVSNSNDDMFYLNQNLEKLIDFIGDKKTVTIEDLEKITGISPFDNIFNLTDTLGKRDIKQSIKILNRLLNKGEHPLNILNMFTRFFTSLLKIKVLLKRGMKTDDIIRILGMHRFIIEKYISFSKNYSGRDILFALKELPYIDIALKKSYPVPGLLLERFILHRKKDMKDNSLNLPFVLDDIEYN